MVLHLKSKFKHVIDLTPFEAEHKALEGKGSIVMDHRNRQIFVALSERSHKDVVDELLRQWNNLVKIPYRAITFQATDRDGKIVYHTDCVLVMLGKHFVICEEAITNAEER